MKEMSLKNMPEGSAGLVKRITTQGMVRRRLMDLGLVPGSRVEVVRRSPLGDPVAYKIRGAIIALREEETDRVIVKPFI